MENRSCQYKKFSGVDVMSDSNILILSAGRRVELVKCFKNAARKIDMNSKVVACDSSKYAPALYFADKQYLLPLIKDPGYIQAIIDICIAEKIALVVPTIDTDLLLLAENRDRIEAEAGAAVLISKLDTVRLCRDKILTHRFLQKNGFRVPELYDTKSVFAGEVKYPLFIKPKSGSSSVNAFKVRSRTDFECYLKMIEDPIIQCFIQGDEYSVDVFLDFEGNPVSIVPRLRMATRNGEISKGKIIKEETIIREIEQLMKSLKAIGHITVQLIKNDTGIYFIEINPRFGGGAPMSIYSGADSCEYILRLLRGDKLTYRQQYKDGIIYLRYDQCVCINDDMEIMQ
ncbi:MAG: ATP-grasp domain-containing protein [Chitinispirillaceae bacterium]